MSLRDGGTGWADTQQRVLSGRGGSASDRGSKGYETFDQMMDRLDRERTAREIQIGPVATAATA